MKDATLAARIEVRRAWSSELGIVVSILDEAAEWLVFKGIEQWEPGSFAGRIAERTGRGEMYLAEMDGRPVRTLALQWSDEETWGDVPDDAGYVHGLAIRRGYAGKGLGCALLRWAENRVAASGGKYLRLDCAAENRALNEYYERAGFEHRGRVMVRGLEVSLYETKAGISGVGSLAESRI